MLPKFRSKGHAIYHYANDGQCSWFEFAEAIVSLAGHDCEVVPVATDQGSDPVIRPKFSVLDTEKTKNTFDVKVP